MSGPSAAPGSLSQRIGNLSTGIKIFAILTAALLPLGVIALLASLYTNRTADTQRRADLRVATSEAARRLSVELGADLALIRSAAEAMATAEGARVACFRVDIMFAGRPKTSPRHALFGPDRALACGSPAFNPPPPPAQLVLAAPRISLADDALTITYAEPYGRGMAVLRYPAPVLGELVKPVGLAGTTAVAVSNNTSELVLQRNDPAFLTATDTESTPLGVFDLGMRITSARSRFSAAEALQAFLPLLMWAAATIVAFLVTDRLLIRPLYQLRQAIAGLTPGARFTVPPINTPAREIRELAETFDRAGDTIAAHEASIARSLDHQVRLTREVHHRVKNNLQVVASLINLHARGADRGPVADAYASIQRRVDALAIVHRNHYAELEDSNGVSAKALLGELAANLRTGLANSGSAPPISIEASAVRVSQDVAVPIAFLVTELTELSISVTREAAIAIMLTECEAGKARLALASKPLAAIGASPQEPEARYARILGGLARQLRSTLEFDATLGGYRIDVPILGQTPVR